MLDFLILPTHTSNADPVSFLLVLSQDTVEVEENEVLVETL